MVYYHVVSTIRVYMYIEKLLFQDVVMIKR